eukprot:4580253-Pyramimonas_sp.AAC.1
MEYAEQGELYTAIRDADGLCRYVLRCSTYIAKKCFIEVKPNSPLDTCHNPKKALPRDTPEFRVLGPASRFWCRVGHSRTYDNCSLLSLIARRSTSKVDGTETSLKTSPYVIRV